MIQPYKDRPRKAISRLFCAMRGLAGRRLETPDAGRTEGHDATTSSKAVGPGDPSGSGRMFSNRLRFPSGGGIAVVLGVCLFGVVGLIWSAPATQQLEVRSTTQAETTLALDGPSIEQRLSEDVRFLASDQLEGRGVDTSGLDAAADYIAEQFREIGLATDHYNGSPFQTFFLSKRLGLGSTNVATLHGPEGTAVQLKLGRDFRPLSLSGSGTFDLPLVFVGYGITAEEHGYDDYAGMNVAGKAVVVLRHEPEQGDPKSVFAGTSISEYAYLANKVKNADDHGAAAVLFCTDFFHLRSQEIVGASDPLLGFEIDGELPERRIPVFHCRRAVLDRVLQSVAETDLAALERDIEEGPTPHSRDLAGWRITGEVSVVWQGKQLKNVVGVLEAEGDRSEETVVLGAHYDHLGWGEVGSLSLERGIHNGADDNASGTAILIEVARRLASARRRVPRRVVFVAFTAEERGLVGSQHYVEDPAFPLNQTVAMLNLDMVGRLRNNRLTVSGTGTSPGFPELLDRISGRYNLGTTKDPGGYGPSDHAPFHARGIPVLHFFTGLHEDYHTPSDDVEKLNLPGMRRISGMVAEMVTEIAGSDADLKPEPAYLGVWRNENHQGVGYAILRVTEGTPAERAGFEAGDVIVRFAERDVIAWQDLHRALEVYQSDDKVVVTVRSGNVELQRAVTLGKRATQ